MHVQPECAFLLLFLVLIVTNFQKEIFCLQKQIVISFIACCCNKEKEQCSWTRWEQLAAISVCLLVGGTVCFCCICCDCKNTNVCMSQLLLFCFVLSNDSINCLHSLPHLPYALLWQCLFVIRSCVCVCVLFSKWFVCFSFPATTTTTTAETVSGTEADKKVIFRICVCDICEFVMERAKADVVSDWEQKLLQLLRKGMC